MIRRVVSLAVIPDASGKLRYFYGGSVLPDGLDGDAVARCVRRGLVKEYDDPAPAVDPEDGDDPDDTADLDEDDEDEVDPQALAKALAEVTDDLIEQADAAVVVTSDGVEHVGVLPVEAALPPRPKRTGTRAAWAEYRAAQGHQVDGLTRDQLAALPDTPAK